MSIKTPSAEQVAEGNPGFSLERVEQLREAERMAERLGVKKPRYSIEPALGGLVTFDGQNIINATGPFQSQH